MPPPPTVQPRPPALNTAFALLILYVVWGSTYLAIAVVIQTMPPLLSAGVRFVIAGSVFLAWTVVRGTFRAERPTAREWGAAAIIGGFLLLGGNGLVMLAEQRIPSGVAALLVSTVPIGMAVMDGIVNRQGVSRLVVFGLVAGLAGVAVLVVPGSEIAAVEPIGALMVLASTLCWSSGSLYARGASLPRNRVLSTGMEMFAGGVLLVAVGTLFGEPWRVDPSRFSAESLLALAYLIVIGSLVAFTAYTWLLSNVATTTVSTYAYVNPIVAVALGALILGEPITLRTLIAGVVIIGAVAAMVYGRPQTVAEDRAPEERADDHGETDDEDPVIRTAAGPAPGPAEQRPATGGR